MKGGKIKWIIIGVIAVLVLCCCGDFTLSQGDDGTDTSSSESTGSQAEMSSANESEEPAAKPVEKKTAAKSPSSTKAPATGRPGWRRHEGHRG